MPSSRRPSCVSIDPGRRSGEPCITGTRIPAVIIAGLVNDGVRPRDVKRWYPGVTAEIARQVTNWFNRNPRDQSKEKAEVERLLMANQTEPTANDRQRQHGHWLTFDVVRLAEGLPPVVGCHCGFRSDLDQHDGYGDDVVEHLLAAMAPRPLAEVERLREQLGDAWNAGWVAGQDDEQIWAVTQNPYWQPSQ